MSERTTTSSPVLSNRLYDFFKWVALIFLPAFGALYYGLSDIWNLPKADEVVGTTVVLDAFLGALLGLSNQRYMHSDARFDGAMVVQHEDGVPVSIDAQLNDIENPLDIVGQKQVVFKVLKKDTET